jgi:hypothetical protein
MQIIFVDFVKGKFQSNPSFLKVGLTITLHY